MSAEITVRHNVIANFIGRLWTAGMALAFVPIYIHLLGAEAYGLVGFFLSLQMVLSLLEMGLGTTSTKELARLSSSSDSKTVQEMGNLVRTLEVVYFGLGIIAAVIVFVSAKPLATHWFNPDTLSRKEIQYVIVIMGLVIAARMPFSFYSGALIGLQRQVTLNAIIVVTITLKNVGAAAILLLISRDVLVFFLWNLIAELMQTAFICYTLRRNLPKSPYKACFQIKRIRNIWRFAAGMTGVGTTNMILAQADKLFVSKMFSLETFGYYSAVWTIAGAPFFFTYPIIIAAFPRYAQLFGKHTQEELRQFYHRSSRMLASVMLPVALCVIFFAREILTIWLGDSGHAQAFENVLQILLLGTILNALTNAPMNLQFASGWTSFVVCTNLVWSISILFLIWWFTSVLGILGAPIAWLVYNLFCFTIVAYVAHERLLQEGLHQWYLRDIGIPLLVSGTIIGIFYLLVPMPIGRVGQFIVLGICVALGEAGNLITVKDIRSTLAKKFSVWTT